jgi:hypothetical protein
MDGHLKDYLKKLNKTDGIKDSIRTCLDNIKSPVYHKFYIPGLFND